VELLTTNDCLAPRHLLALATKLNKNDCSKDIPCNASYKHQTIAYPNPIALYPFTTL